MISLNKAIETGKFIQIFSYRNPIEYGYESPKKSLTGFALKTDINLIAQISANRAKSHLRALIIGNMYHYLQYKPVFLTLTFTENIQSLEKANYKFRQFIKRFDYKLGYKLRYVSVPEFQERGAVHYHLIIFNIPFIKGQDIEKIWAYGKTDIKLVNRGTGAFNYIVKYLNKSFKDARYKGKKRYFYSLVNHSVETRDEDTVEFIFQQLNIGDLIKEYQYEIKDKGTDLIYNSVKKAEYITPKRISFSPEGEIPHAQIIS